jgi:hypothetical protein
MRPLSEVARALSDICPGRKGPLRRSGQDPLAAHGCHSLAQASADDLTTYGLAGLL